MEQAVISSKISLNFMAIITVREFKNTVAV